MADQPMRILVTLKALPMLVMNNLGVRQAMTLLAGRSGGMHALVAIGTVYAAVIRIRISKIAGLLCVANLTE